MTDFPSFFFLEKVLTNGERGDILKSKKVKVKSSRKRSVHI